MKSEMTRSVHEPIYEVVWPLGKTAPSSPIKAMPPVLDLNGKTVGLLWDYTGRGDVMFSIARELLRQRFPEVKFVGYESFGNFHGANEAEVIAALPDLLRKHGCDAVISAAGV